MSMAYDLLQRNRVVNQKPCSFYPVRNNAPLGFESRYSGTRISNGVYEFIINK